MGRRSSKEGLSKGPWTVMEDEILTDYVKAHGEGKWGNVPKRAGLNRCGKSCRLRWLNYLRPDIKRGNISPDEEDLIIRLHKLLGNRWALIAGRLPGRTDNEIKNYWNTYLCKKSAQGNQSSTKRKPISRKVTPIANPTDHHQVSFTTNLQSVDEYHHTFNMSLAPPTTATWVQHNAAKQKDISSQFVKDFNAENISISDYLDLDFPQLRDFDTYDTHNLNVSEKGGVISTNIGHKSQLSICSDKGQAFLVPDWSGDDPVLQTNLLEPDFGSLASLMESTDEWMYN
ncbi:hypothetical protein K2173_015943 [Erythroxylum novogranatense]|uniref:Myb-related protein 123 n=1 Tax=Erythroxylum novogranatense TaxID=1862640 RepID=A0AAV8SEW4_9ROSI|nr:hypothetical protein K2173_015943 [Erythroxylum novogranatense]